MKSMYLGNAFSLNMVQGECNVEIREIADPIGLLSNSVFKNVIGHPETDVLVRNILEKGGLVVPPGERATIRLALGDVLVVAQYVGPRLTEGATSLPAGATLVWFSVRILVATQPCGCVLKCFHELTYCISCEFYGHNYECPLNSP